MTLNECLKEQVWPVLESQGFTYFAEGRAWRAHRDRIDLVSFLSNSRPSAFQPGSAVRSFSVHLGCHLLYIPCHVGPQVTKEALDVFLPDETLCQFRTLMPTAHRPPRDSWMISAQGRNLAFSVAEALAQLQSQGLSWFTRFASPEAILGVLTHTAPGPLEGLWGDATEPGPLRSYYTGYTALHVRRPLLAQEHLGIAAGASAYFTQVLDTLKRDLQTAIDGVRKADGTAKTQGTK